METLEQRINGKDWRKYKGLYIPRTLWQEKTMYGKIDKFIQTQGTKLLAATAGFALLLNVGCGAVGSESSASYSPAPAPTPAQTQSQSMIPPNPPSIPEPLQNYSPATTLTDATFRDQQEIPLSQGWTTISFPFESVASTAGFGYNLFWFDGTAYQVVDPQNHPEQIDCAKGYWAYSDNAGNVAAAGTENTTIISTTLQQGWNFFGYPNRTSTNVADLFVRYNRIEQSLPDAANLQTSDPTELLYGRLYNYADNQWNQQIVSNAVIEPTKAYWLWSWNNNTELLFTRLPEETGLSIVEDYFTQLNMQPTRNTSGIQLNLSYDAQHQAVIQPDGIINSVEDTFYIFLSPTDTLTVPDQEVIQLINNGMPAPKIYMIGSGSVPNMQQQIFTQKTEFGQ